MNYNEKLEELSNTILAAAIKSKPERMQLLTDFAPELFRNENYLIYKVMTQFREQHLVPDKEFLLIYLHGNIPMILDDVNVDKSLFATTDGEVVDEVIASTIEQLEDLQGYDVNDELLASLPNKKQTFKELYKSQAIDQLIEDMTIILKDGLKVGRRTLHGPTDADEYYSQGMERIKSMVSNEEKEFFDYNEVSLVDDAEKPRKIATFGDLETLNTYFGGGLYTGMFYTVMAPTKGGKSKFCFRTAHNAWIEHGNNVLFWPYEGGRKKAKAEFRAIHFVYYWEVKRGIDLGKDNFIKPRDILYDRYPSEELRAMELESNADMENNPAYGKMTFIEKPLRIDTYLATLEVAIEKQNPAIVFVDYLQLIGSALRGPLATLSKPERIGQAYQDTLGLIKRKNVAFMSPAQMKQESIKELSQGRESDSRTMGGETSEIIRTPDYNIALYATPEDIENGVMTLKSIPSREAEPFSDFQIGVHLGYDYFYDIE